MQLKRILLLFWKGTENLDLFSYRVKRKTSDRCAGVVHTLWETRLAKLSLHAGNKMDGSQFLPKIDYNYENFFCNTANNNG